MADIQSYERVLKKKGIKEKVIMLLLYAFILLIWVFIFLGVGINPAVILLCPISIAVVAAVTWKYTCVEYEYSIMAGTFTFSKIYGKSTRSTVEEFEVRSAISVFPYNEKTSAKIKSGGKVIDALPSSDSQNPCVCFFEDDNENKVYFLFDCDEMTAKIFKFFSASATERSIFDKL